MVVKKNIDTIVVKKNTGIAIALFCGIATIHDTIEFSFKINQWLSLDTTVWIFLICLLNSVLLLLFNYIFPKKKWLFSRHLIIISFCISLIFVFSISAQSIHTSIPSIPIIKNHENPKITLLEEEIRKLKEQLKEKK